METCAARVATIYRAVKAIDKHIVSEKPLSCRSGGIGVDESAPGGIVITALEIIQACFLDQVIASTPNQLMAGFQALAATALGQ